jgi:K+-transporting ATPase KdpF subunit
MFGLRVSMFRQYLLGPWAPAPTVRFVLPQQDYPATCGGPMTVVAGIIALLLLGYLVVALLNPERF